MQPRTGRKHPVRSTIVYLNGRYLPASRAQVSAFDRGFLYGDGLFETVRIYRGIPFALDAHLKRMRASGRRIGLVIPHHARIWNGIIRELLRRNRLLASNTAVRLTVIRGIGGEGLLPPRRVHPTVLLTLRRLDPEIPHLQERGVAVVLLPFHPGIGAFLAGVKTVDYLTASIAKRIARRRGAYEGVYCTPNGEILEGTTSNIFIVRGRSVLTPRLASGVLPGVTRSLVLKIAASEGFRAHEQRIKIEDLKKAEEAFLTASTIEILPIRSVENRRVGNRTWPTTRQLQKAFADHRP